MKQTNNAIKFLMAQYRAVFKSAYVSGITTAVALTSFLAAAQANAAPTELKVDNWDKALEASETLVINGETSTDPAKGEYSKLAITATDNKTLTLSDKQKLSLVGDKVSDAKISVTTQGKTLSLTGEGALEVDAKNGLTIEATASGSNANVDLGTVNIKKGTLTLKASDAKATVNLAANSIVIGNGESGEGATVTLSGAGTNVLGGTSSSIVVKGNGQVVTKDTGNSIQGSSLVAEKGSKFTFDGTTDYKVQSSTFTSSTIEVAAGGTLNVDLAEIGTGKPGQMTITGAEKETSKVNVGGTLNINTGVVNIDKHVELKSSATGKDDKIVIGDGQQASKFDKAVFKIGKDTLLGYLDSKGTGNKGSVDLQSGGVLYITDEVNLKDLTFGDQVADATISQTDASGGALGGSNIVITQAASSANTVAIKADKITFGVKPEDKNQTAQATDFATGVGHLEAKNLEVAGKSHTLQETLILRNVAVADDKVTAGEGKASGNLIIGKSATKSGDLVVDGGKFNYTSGDMTLVSGSIVVKNTDSGKGAVSNLTFDKDTKIIVTGANAAFEAKATGEKSVLDISKATLEAATTGTGNNATNFSAESGGRLVISKAQVEAVSKATTDPLQKVAFKAGENGTLAFSDEVTLELGTGKTNPISVADIAASGAGQTIGGTLEANSGLTLNYTGNAGTNPHYAVSGTLVASNLKVNAKEGSTAKDFVLGDGVYKISSGLDSENSGNFVVISGSNNTDHEKSTLLLGAVSTNEKGELVTSKGGSATNIEVQANGIVGVQSGEWNGKKLKVTDGSFTIGYKDTTGDKTANAAFNGTDLTVANANTFVINRGSSAKFETVSGGAASAIKVNGSLTITGKDGVDFINAGNTATGTIEMGANSEVTLGEHAVKKGITKVDGDTVTFDSSFEADQFKMGKNATFNLNLGALATDKEKTITISAKGLETLKDQLFKDYQNGQIDGFLNIGKADIKGLNISGDKVSWTEYKNFQDTISSVTSDKLSKATVTGVSGNEFKGSVGAVSLDSNASNLTVTGNTILANASGNNGFFVSKSDAAANVSLESGNFLTLSGGGKAGTISLKNGTDKDNKTTLVISSKDGAPVTELAGIAGQNGSSPAAADNAVQILGKTKVTGEIKDIVDLEIGSELEVTANVTVKNLKSLASKGVTLKMDGKDLTVSGEANFAGDITAKTASFSKTGAKPEDGNYDAKLGGNNTIGTLNIAGHGMINNGGTTKVTETMTVAAGKTVTVAQSATLDAKHITLTQNTGSGNTQLIVGQDSKTVKKNGIDIAIGSSTGYLVANTMQLNGGDLIADPDFGGAASIVSVAGFGAANTDLTKNAGTLDGKAIALQNSILAVGVEQSDKTLEKLQELFADYLDPRTGSLISEGYGSIMYVAKNVTVEDANGKLIIDPKRGLEKYKDDMASTTNTEYKDAVNNNAAYIGEGAALAVSAVAAVNSFDENTKAQNAAIKFNKNGATVYAEKNSTVLLTGDFSSMDNIKLFADNEAGASGGVTIKGNNLKATTLSGVYEFIMKKDQQTDANGFQLTFNKDVLDKSYHDASHPARNTIVAYAKKELANGTKLHGDFVAGVTFDTNTSEYKKTDGTVLTDAQIKYYMHIGDKVYTKVNNRFLENITQNLNYGHDVDTITRLGAYSGVAHSAIAAGNVTTNAVAARFAIGSSPVDFIAAQNNMGGSAFVAPMMNQFESDGFDSEGVSYGVDVDTTGVAFGGDFEFTPQLRAGVLFNIGSGDAKGKGQASTASSDFDFYGLSVYAGYNVDRFAVVADVSYTKIDNEVKAFITDETIKADSNATNISLGVNAQYTFDFNQIAVTPHMGLRYSMIEADDYSIRDAGSFSSDKMSVFSVPVGVTIAQAYASDNWIVTPYADFTVTGNFGDNSYKGSFKWANVANLTTDTDTEVMDNFSYGLTLGINGETGNLGMSAGLNYTSSSNTDNLGFSASCRYLF
ncbi:MAG: autotransporter outer membrane beta-barrel domain-containing protein [Anaerobiospirillum succiniciproducens]|uniref:autotransporter outer membrane beta-barrel domain-containing protein n=1 Tax=Anaerobiospirillum succiniciproducens TaxID=13335 RepID=UPI002A75662F|nr:autotransporter outer membrane beta-barrel domain-containing protein [Anaerobiospirillum succiniciproducens]MDY2798884.1 autotransporter outer membrane beta-barrel domain-containing protein [Anaerobiospirillum succiniciproducens]